MTDEAITPEIIELILRTCRVPQCSDVYSLAPRGHRIGFYFQQRRAVLLAAAIAGRTGHEQLKTKRIAVIGGGATGLSFLLAIMSQGAKQVSLYEAADSLARKGTGASHRLVHPNYNRWPLLGSMDVFTSLPELNWYAASGDKVAAQLSDKFKDEHAELISDRVNFGHKVEEIAERGSSHGNRLKVTFVHGGSKQSEDFDLVVVAAGFGDERSLDWKLADYWTADPNDFDVDVHVRPSTVYGTGDGALIDILRCCAKKPEDAWEIPLGMIARLRDPAANTIVRDSDKVLLRQTPFTEVEKRIQKHEESVRSIAWAMSRSDLAAMERYAKAEEKFYHDCIRSVLKESRSTRDFLESLLKPAVLSPRRPILCGTLGSPFEPTAAPINKLILAYLLESNRIEFVSRTRKAQVTELTKQKKRIAAGNVQSIAICRFGAVRNFPCKSGKAKPPNGIRVKLKNGGGMASETGVEADLIDALSGITGGGYIFFDGMPDPLTKARHSSNPIGATQVTRNRNIGVLRGFAVDELKASDVDIKSDSQGSKWVICTPLEDADITKKLNSLGGLDGNFLGLPIVVAKEIRVSKDRF
jgi:hypothetical protein